MNEEIVCTFYVKTKDGVDMIYDCYVKEILYLSINNLINRSVDGIETSFDNNHYKVFADFKGYYNLMDNSKGMICEGFLFKTIMAIFKKYLANKE